LGTPRGGRRTGHAPADHELAAVHRQPDLIEIDRWIGGQGGADASERVLLFHGGWVWNVVGGLAGPMPAQVLLFDRGPKATVRGRHGTAHDLVVTRRISAVTGHCEAFVQMECQSNAPRTRAPVASSERVRTL